MSRIFATVALATVLLGGAVALGVAQDESGSESEQVDEIAEIFATSIDISVWLPLVLVVGLMLATLGVFARA